MPAPPAMPQPCRMGQVVPVRNHVSNKYTVPARTHPVRSADNGPSAVSMPPMRNGGWAVPQGSYWDDSTEGHAIPRRNAGTTLSKVPTRTDTVSMTLGRCSDSVNFIELNTQAVRQAELASSGSTVSSTSTWTGGYSDWVDSGDLGSESYGPAAPQRSIYREAVPSRTDVFAL
eukprot:gnl/TRDRNA2_/TRDRNA2_176379_c0_seq1.p1 gnl/TRDRNA2_/TRDRNA2_176379_c0~~gnl/TRDRNA2_/TRDRNA2_176379_c0_seq1.p1  ORF type:complete len:187 (-),score=7.93 gnl/TRDRNA2_/TRDRNA2_176379_c0_seq1:421-939(-)